MLRHANSYISHLIENNNKNHFYLIYLIFRMQDITLFCGDLLVTFKNDLLPKLGIIV